jgi:hypothetical protein
MTEVFWFNNPKILLDKNHIGELWPNKDLDYTSKLNAVTRLVLVLALFGLLTGNYMKILIATAITLVIIVMMHNSKKSDSIKKQLKEKIIREGFTNQPQSVKLTPTTTAPTKNNPLMNVLLTDIKDNPTREAAQPSFNPTVERKINESAGNVGPDPKLFTDLGDAISFEQSMQRFYTTANSRVANDQRAFAEFCYGNMPSCKSGDDVACLKENPRWTTP